VDGRGGDGEETGERRIRVRRGNYGEECCGVRKILKIDPGERLYLFKRMT